MDAVRSRARLEASQSILFVMLDTPHPVLDNPLLRLAGTQFVLVEFPFMSIPPNSAYAVRELREAGWIPIVAHSRGRCTAAGALRALKDQGFIEQVATIVGNGKRLVGGQRPLPGTPMEQRPKQGWKKAFPWI